MRRGRTPAGEPHPPSPDPASGSCGCGGSCPPHEDLRLDRRAFLRTAGAALAAAAGGIGGAPAVAGPFDPADVADHFVPADKKLRPEWVATLFERGGAAWRSGDELATIAMPIGGIGAGQLALAGDGRLAHFDLCNRTVNTGYGQTNYREGRRPAYPVAQGFAVRVRSDGNTIVRALDRVGFPGVRFLGEYPMAWIEYDDPVLPVSVALEAFSPFLPLRAEESALPATVLEFTLRNRSSTTVEVEIAGWLENAVGLESARERDGVRSNRVVRFPDVGATGFTALTLTASEAPPPTRARAPRIFADFEGEDYEGWTVEGEAFGSRPARGTLPNQQPVSGFEGQGLVNTYLGGNDRLQGRLVSPEFTIERPWIRLLVGGGRHPGRTCVNLVVEDATVRTVTGRSEERLLPCNWNVRDLLGRHARIEIVDAESGGWGHVNVDRIEFADEPRAEGAFAEQADAGSMALALLDAGSAVFAATRVDPDALPTATFDAAAAAGGIDPARGAADIPFGAPAVGSLGRSIRLAPGESGNATFVVAWFFPNRPVHGHRYAARFDDAAGVARHVAGELPRLASATRLWHATYYGDSSLPRWLLDRLHSTASTLATSTCQWWRNGRFWAFEGVGCCHGTCGHVWNYAHAPARLFPELERSVREMQDLNPEAGFIAETGAIRFRGEGWGLWAGDAQAGTILKCYREHLVSPDAGFLERNWPRIRKALEFLLAEDRGPSPDARADGILEGRQHNTYDIDFYGANTMVGSLYLAALRAGEEMARVVEDAEFAATCRTIFEAGRARTMERLFDGEYFIQDVDPAQHPRDQYGDGCLADQLFGEGWARQVGLGALYPEDAVRSALRAIWKYDWAPDVRRQNEAHPPERWFARPGEAGLFTCTWPKGKHPGDASVRYRDEVWTGIEYQVAGHMAWEGLVTEALAICRAIHERYDPAKRNPWNEVECGDHYARAMASWGVFLALCGFEYDGPRGHLGFAPRLAPESFRAAFTAAEGWGSIAQERTGGGQRDRIEVRWGRVRLRSLAFEVPADLHVREASVSVEAGGTIPSRVRQEGSRVRIELGREVAVEAGSTLAVTLSG